MINLHKYITKKIINYSRAFSTLTNNESTKIQAAAIKILMKNIRKNEYRPDDDLIGIINKSDTEPFQAIKNDAETFSDFGRIRLIYDNQFDFKSAVDRHSDKNSSDYCIPLQDKSDLKSNTDVWNDQVNRHEDYEMNTDRFENTLLHSCFSQRNLVLKYDSLKHFFIECRKNPNDYRKYGKLKAMSITLDIVKDKHLLPLLVQSVKDNGYICLGQKNFMPEYCQNYKFRTVFEASCGFKTRLPNADNEKNSKYFEMNGKSTSLEEQGIRGVIEMLSKLFRSQEKAIHVLAVIPFEDGPQLILKNDSQKTQSFVSAGYESWLIKDSLTPFTKLIKKFELTANLVDKEVDKLPENYKQPSAKYRTKSIMNQKEQFTKVTRSSQNPDLVTFNGPFWSGPLFDSTFISNLVKDLECNTPELLSDENTGMFLKKVQESVHIQNEPFGIDEIQVKQHIKDKSDSILSEKMDKLNANYKKARCVFNNSYVKFGHNRNALFE